MSMTKARKRMQVWYRYMDHIYRLSYDTTTPSGYERTWSRYCKAIYARPKTQARISIHK